MATAREIAHANGSFLCGPNDAHCIACNRFTAAIERDRAESAALVARLRQGLEDVARMACPGRGYTMQMIRRRAIGATMNERFCRCPHANEPAPCDSWSMGGVCESEDRAALAASPQVAAPADEPERDPDVRPTWSETGLPLCDDACPNFDGKRCKAMGFRPDRFCEPELIHQAELLARYRAHQVAPGTKP